MKSSGNTILVTGGGSGIGRALAQAWHDDGNRVIVAGRRRDALDETIAGRDRMEARVLDVDSPDALATIVNDLIADAVVAGALGMVWTGAKVLLRTDYHGWDNFIAWCRLDARCLDTREWDGARLASFPLRSPYRSGALGDAD